jgi:hypothetical protein
MAATGCCGYGCEGAQQHQAPGEGPDDEAAMHGDPPLQREFLVVVTPPKERRFPSSFFT